MSLKFDFNKVNEAAQKDILELDRRIDDLKNGKEDEIRKSFLRPSLCDDRPPRRRALCLDPGDALRPGNLY